MLLKISLIEDRFVSVPCRIQHRAERPRAHAGPPKATLEQAGQTMTANASIALRKSAWLATRVDLRQGEDQLVWL